MSTPHPPARESGQAAVEAALVVPMMVFLVLGIIQLGMMHHARMMTEYAAYRAVRSGIVNGGSCEYMRDSAIIGLLPTLGPMPGIPGRTDTLVNALKVYQGFKLANMNDLRYLPSGLKVVKLEVLNPRKSQLGSLFNTYGVYGATSGQTHTEEIDYDDVRDATVIAGNLLTVRVTYNYEMRVPYANKFIHGWWIGLQYLGDLRGVQFDNQKAFGAISESTYLEGRGAARGGDFARMALLATTRGVYVLPMIATYSMRMQSNLMKNQISACAIN
ncbi:pilus assembly protein [Myxococcaceae bacterium GXIMD 01537]